MAAPLGERTASVRLYLLPLILFSFLCLIPNESPSGDTFGYARGLLKDASTPQLNPNHLLLLPALRAAMRVAEHLTPEGGPSPVSVLLWTARLSYLASGILFLYTARRLFGEDALAGALGLGFLASHAVLSFGSEGEPILLGHLPLLAACTVHLAATRGAGQISSVAAGFLYGLSVLFLANNALVAGPIIAIALLGSEGKRRRDGLLLAGLAVLLPVAILAAAHAQVKPDASVLGWVTGYGGGDFRLAYGGSATLSIFRAVFGFGDSLMPVRGAARLVRRWTEGPGSIAAHPGDAALLALWAVTVIAVATLTMYAALRAVRGTRYDRGVGIALILSVASIGAFNLKWIGSDLQFWVPAVPFFFLLWGYALRGRERATRSVAVVALGIALPLNLFVSILPERTDRAAVEERAAVLRGAPPGSLVLTPGLDWADGIGHFAPPPGIELLSLWRLSAQPEWADDPEGYYRAVDSTVAHALRSGRSVYLKGVIEEPFPAGVPWREMRPRGFELERLQEVLAKYRRLPTDFHPGATYWLLGVDTLRSAGEAP